MESFEDALKELRVEFVREGVLRAAAAEGLLERLAADPANAEGLAELRRLFHGFAGSGTTYGFPSVTAFGLQGERACLALQTAERTPGQDVIVAWRGLVGEIRAALGGAPSGTRPEESAWARTAPTGPAARILVVDDDPEVCALLRRALEPEGFHVTCAHSRAEAESLLKEKLPDGLIVDILLADGSGYALVEQLRSRPGGESPVVLVISLRGDFLDKVEAIHCGADGYFEKPLDWEGLVRRLRLLLGRNAQDVPRILCVEDDPLQAVFVRAVLESAGYAVRVCDDPKRFESELVAFDPDLVTMDIVLPGMSGYDLVRSCARNPATRRSRCSPSPPRARWRRGSRPSAREGTSTS
jgi:DNA-binding response OmpR family regulator